MPRSVKLRSKAAAILRAGRRDAALRRQPMSSFYLALASSYKRLADLAEQAQSAFWDDRMRSA